MRIVIQKVTNGKVLFKDEIIREINDGHIFYVGIAAEDTEEKLEEYKKWIIKFIEDTKQDALLLSQFTLFAQFNGKKPSFHNAKNNNEARKMFEKLVDEVKKNIKTKVESGLFGECLDIIYSSEAVETIYKDFNK
ncbi:hypothetical protein NCER_100166 [Vairimorpha ceranae BRL01]|uniref:D-aminoacyl-tRNA deacylase n=2 Tax=Vairimorpha ceranae TaxID=40302 RepID=C4V6W8_VAIC1|nr:d-tyrosyl-trna deacylase [Vairimorpha ceranae]EEQ83034.1 hypothetical protein NCER_100166 [Vairimorpha ceranae BRL01]KAF5141322.1 hypothetical protein G9O61_00g006390 [Vairimorpha ceranae]KKO76562.1 d-tyrosyl-trna deacylase [Vairimorpha ceranae]